jgi:hypothetical protein
VALLAGRASRGVGGQVIWQYRMLMRKSGC